MRRERGMGEREKGREKWEWILETHHLRMNLLPSDDGFEKQRNAIFATRKLPPPHILLLLQAGKRNSEWKQ